MDDYNSFNNNDLVYDLRQTRVKIIEAILFRTYEFKCKEDYINWFKCLRDLYTIVNHKLKSKEETEYNNLRIEVLQILNKNELAYLKKDRNPVNVENVISALETLERWLWKKMDEHKLFGAKEEVIL